MKQRLFLALVVLVMVSFSIVFRVDSTPPTPAPAAEKSDSLRSIVQKQGFGIGTAVELSQIQKDAKYREVLIREFNLLVPENAWKFNQIHPKRDRYNFTDVDALIDFAKANNMQMRGHPLVWHYSLPQWVEYGNYTRDELIEILRNHIQTVVGRYRGQVAVWDVVNEIINRDGSWRDTIWLRKIGPEYIDMAFRWAHEADPQARLFYGDYSSEEVGQKSDGIYTMVAGMLQRGVPINGIGFQAHLRLDYLPNLDSLAQNFERFNKLGLEVQFTELDITIHDSKGSKEERLAGQARAYADLLRVCRRAQKCTGYVTWGFTDRYTWIANTTGELDAPLIFDQSYRPKPAYEAIKEVLMSETSQD